ncbi:MAG: indole-3-glycerol phosphate synthase TrpC [Propionibacteriaceae bacterium]|jgi:indole-3-glycerol phosphate synthase|nr:indole-3-glycerol phosphate synthase TrpC [Propionibacteriaceae bacterium]
MASTTILDQIAAATRARVESEKEKIPPRQMRLLAEETIAEYATHGIFQFPTALNHPGLAFICEVKKASPSKGVIADAYPYVQIAQEYEAAGAAAISVLTEPTFFQGRNSHVAEIVGEIHIPVLRKDFILDPYQLDQSRVLGAAAVLLIASLLGDRLKTFIDLARNVGVAPLVEVHDEAEARRALDAGALIIGVNHRDLRTFDIDLTLSERIRPLVPRDHIFVAESGIATVADVRRMKDIGVDAILVGESLMRADDKGALLRDWAAA